MQFNQDFFYMLNNHDNIDIYGALGSDDTSDLVMIGVDLIKKFRHVIPLPLKSIKTEATSTALRNEGNKEYNAGNYERAFQYYNKALLYAPNKSLPMKLAYSNRSALLLNHKQYSSCLQDIETCFAMGCPEDIMEKLKKRKEKACEYAQMERISKELQSSTFCNEFFKLHSSRNPQIPCASTAVGVIREAQVPKVVATTDIEVGTVVAVENAFVSTCLPQMRYFSCHHCQKMTLNLIPCNTCCFALFCNEDCMRSSLDEYHRIECCFMDIVNTLDMQVVLAFQGTLKIHKMCNSWKKLIEASRSFGAERIMGSSINDIFDVDNMFSLLNFRDDKHFVHGARYNTSFICAIIIDCLDKIQTFFPQSLDEKKEAMSAIARIMMHLTVHGIFTNITPAVTVIVKDMTGPYNTPNFGWFSFTGKLKQSCTPNLIVVGLNSGVALIALQPIKSGSELTISNLTHYLDGPFDTSSLQKALFGLYGFTCNCIVCSGEWETRADCPLTEVQKRNFNKLNFDDMMNTLIPQKVSNTYRKLCQSLALLHDVPYSNEYRTVYKMFRKSILLMQNAKCYNTIIDCYTGP